VRTDHRNRLVPTLLATAVAAAGTFALLIAFGAVDTSSDEQFAAVLALTGVMFTTAATLVSERRLAGQHRDEEARLRLDAAMQAGTLIKAHGMAPADPAAIASGLLALTQLGREDLAVALLVDLWLAGADTAATGQAPQYIADESAILVVDAALTSSNPSAQLVAAELLCRNAHRLDLCQSLHWPSSVDGTWNPAFGVRTKVLIVDALVRMAYTTPASINALQVLAVRLFGISASDPDPHVKGCLGMLIEAIAPALERLKVRSLMQGPREITIDDIRRAAGHAKANPDRVFYKIVRDRSNRLADWASGCFEPDYSPGALGATVVSAASEHEDESATSAQPAARSGTYRADCTQSMWAAQPRGWSGGPEVAVALSLPPGCERLRSRARHARFGRAPSAPIGRAQTPASPWPSRRQRRRVRRTWCSSVPVVGRSTCRTLATRRKMA
jgi:hypothetical protein